MSQYKISEYTKKQAIKLNVEVKPSTNKNKKVDVFKNNTKIATIGDINYNDYPSWIKKEGKTYADQRRKLYKIRHKNDLDGKNGYYANKLLW